jgi:hypothetical protein
MNFALRTCLLCAPVLLAFAPFAGAQQPPMQVNVTSVADSGRFVVFDHGKPVANEVFEYDVTGDSLLVTALHTRKLRASDGVERLLRKNFGMVVDGFDFGLRSYTSNLDFDGHVNVRGLLPGDTSMTVYYETDGAGDASRIVQPPGRLFVMDPLLFTLFDVIGKNVHGKSFASRPIQLIALGKEAMPVEAQVTRAGSDTVQWGARRVIAERFTLTDPGSSFVMWVNDKGQMLRLENRANDLVVLREAPAARAATRRAPPKQRPAAR